MGKNNLSFVLFLLIIPFIQSCVTTPVKYFSKKFIIVQAERGDNFAELAEKYLNDPEKGWLISEFNNINEIREGSEVVIPLDPFKLGGLSSTGYQTIPVLYYTEIGKIEFEKQIKLLNDSDIKIVSLVQILDFMAFKTQLPEKSVLLCFEIPIVDFENNILPVLDQYKMPSALFINLEQIDKLDYDDKSILKCLNSEKVSVNVLENEFLTAENISDYESFNNYFDDNSEYIKKMKTLLTKYGKTDDFYYATHNENNNSLIINILKKNGYKSAFCNSGKANPFFADLYNLSFIKINGETNFKELKKKLVFFKKQDFK